ncbi:hypothetical protein MNBD_CHLOROFLEXI01-3904 [hydrothermal vent metagenome]|uniref:Uncharacterized protein n=1 Tax=hydrothermal vent metagenome TaxID=652676 RepID=A0A3B0VK10_9ZZZZ
MIVINLTGQELSISSFAFISIPTENAQLSCYLGSQGFLGGPRNDKGAHFIQSKPNKQPLPLISSRFWREIPLKLPICNDNCRDMSA